MRTRTWWRLTAAVRGLDPGYLGLVMATGIVARALSLDGAMAVTMGAAVADRRWWKMTG